ncbi:MAG: adenosine deaminase, partial [Verrucomicrobiaceae bacterium]
SSPSAASVSAYQVVAKAYRRAQVKAVELRFNPQKRMRHGLHTMDAIILAVMQGLERASLHYGVSTGIILSLGRDLSLEANWLIIEAAIKWRSRGSLNGANGVVGIDMAGPESRSLELSKPWMSEVAAMMEKAREAGLKITYHVGESEATGPEGLARVLKAVRPDRIGHGIELRNAKGKKKEALLSLLRENSTCLELCPTVNLVTRVVPDYACVANFVRDLAANEIPYCINTDNPYLIHTNLRREYDVVGNELGVDAKPLLDLSMNHATEHSFLSR